MPTHLNTIFKKRLFFLQLNGFATLVQNQLTIPQRFIPEL
jgi:hypothetical protein